MNNAIAVKTAANIQSWKYASSIAINDGTNTNGNPSLAIIHKRLGKGIDLALYLQPLLVET